MRRALFLCVILIVLMAVGFTALFFQYGTIHDTLRGVNIPPKLDVTVKKMAATSNTKVKFENIAGTETFYTTITSSTTSEFSDAIAAWKTYLADLWGTTTSNVRWASQP